MKTKTKIILGVSLTLVLLAGTGAAIIAGAAYYVVNELNIPERIEKLEKAKADGIEYAKTTDQNGCMEKGFRLSPPADSYDIGNVTFVRECLGASRPTAHFCDGVPFVLDRQWFAHQCKLAGHETDSCTTAFIAKRDYCRMDGEKTGFFHRRDTETQRDFISEERRTK